MTRTGQPIHGWLVLDKPPGMSSSRAVGAVRRLLDAAKAGHGGTLDPLATGVLPIALGEATKTVAWVMAGPKTYRFTLRWGEARDTDDAEGRITGSSPVRPTPEAIAAALPRFSGTLAQRPPAFSALKLGGKRAYDLARQGAAVALAERLVEVQSLRFLGAPDPDHAEFEAVVGKGTYIRALARDLGLALGTLAHITQLRRLAVGRFRAEAAISLDNLAALGHSAAASGHLFPVETALDDIPALALSEDEAHRLRCGQAVTPLRPSDRAFIDQLGDGATVRATTGGKLVAVAEIAAGGIRPVRVLNL
ncbi:MAG TPA: tRNA pseudouridine(55) synthase TruB [Stellaceae bacterium]|jgi:tRNA pseudouridine55 synthase|nr:tRNA pseudouridine(55) synthase TruB [Stellaceae bacterium]